MKKTLAIMMAALLLSASLTACGGGDKPASSEPGSTLSGTGETTNNVPEESTTEISTSSEDEAKSVISQYDSNADDEVFEIRLLTLEKSLHTCYEWADDYDRALVRSEHSCVTLGQVDADAYPEMAEVLNQLATMQENAMLDEFDNLVSIAREELVADREGFETNVSTLDVQVRRADSLVISLLSDSYSHFGQIENYRAFHGSNYDPQSGRELMLNDVVNVNNDLAQAVETELTTAVWAGDFYSETTVEDYFANTPYDCFNWTIDYLGLTFYFSPGDLSDDGMMTATVSFAEYPMLFNEKYLVVPTEYAVEIPLDISFFIESDTNDALEAISISGWYNDEQNHYMDYGIYTDTDGQYYEEECYAYDLHPYYVKAADGNYVYLFCEDFEEEHREMRLVVFSLNADGSVTKTGEMNVSPSWLDDNKFIVPTDPGMLILDDADNGTEKSVFAVGNDGMPSKT